MFSIEDFSQERPFREPGDSHITLGSRTHDARITETVEELLGVIMSSVES
jgi:hypothetical protein